MTFEAVILTYIWISLSDLGNNRSWWQIHMLESVLTISQETCRVEGWHVDQTCIESMSWCPYHQSSYHNTHINQLLIAHRLTHTFYHRLWTPINRPLVPLTKFPHFNIDKYRDPFQDPNICFIPIDGCVIMPCICLAWQNVTGEDIWAKLC